MVNIRSLSWCSHSHHCPIQTVGTRPSPTSVSLASRLFQSCSLSLWGTDSLHTSTQNTRDCPRTAKQKWRSEGKACKGYKHKKAWLWLDNRMWKLLHIFFSYIHSTFPPFICFGQDLYSPCSNTKNWRGKRCMVLIPILGLWTPGDLTSPLEFWPVVLVLLAFRYLLWPRPMCPIAKGRSLAPQEASHPSGQGHCAVSFHQPRAATQWDIIQTILDHWEQRISREHTEEDIEETKVPCEREREFQVLWCLRVCYFSQWIRV